MGRCAPSRRHRGCRAAAGRWSSPPGAPCWGEGRDRNVGSSRGLSFDAALEPGAELALAPFDVGHRDVLLLLVREHRVAGTEVDGRYAEHGEPRDVGPPELRVHRGRGVTGAA